MLLTMLHMLAGSCEEQSTDYLYVLEEKEIVDPAAFVRVDPVPGRYLVLLKWKRSPDPSVTEYGIYWNNSRDSSVVESISENASDTVEAYIGNLDEGVYSFTIYSFDKEGNRSIPLITENVKIYGDKYQR